VRSAEQFEAARRLIAAGVNDCAIARQIGAPRTTVRDWRCRPQLRPRLVSAGPACGVLHDFSALPPAAYCYAFGLYLGDGCISRSQRVWHPRITLDKKYPGIIDRCREAIDMLMPRQHASIAPHSQKVASSFRTTQNTGHVCSLSTGRAGHTGPIRLEPWQEVLVKQATEEFIRGLIDSDGCRVVANDRGVRSVRYHFSNRSRYSGTVLRSA
jgi:hypothetical protein